MADRREERSVGDDGREARRSDGSEASRSDGYEASRFDGVLRLRRPGTEWLSTGWNGGREIADAAYNVSVPEGWHVESIGEYVTDRLDRAGVSEEGPTLLTGVDLEHARGARLGSVTAVATAGLSNVAALPRAPAGGELPDPGTRRPPGTVNLLVGTSRRLAPGALANLVAVVAEAKAATLLAETGVPGTTTDAIVVGHDPDGPPAEFSGSGTAVGAASRACVREAVTDALASRYADSDVPASATDAEHGVSTDVEAERFRPDRG